MDGLVSLNALRNEIGTTRGEFARYVAKGFFLNRDLVDRPEDRLCSFVDAWTLYLLKNIVGPSCPESIVSLIGPYEKLLESEQWLLVKQTKAEVIDFKTGTGSCYMIGGDLCYTRSLCDDQSLASELKHFGEDDYYGVTVFDYDRLLREAQSVFRRAMARDS